WDLTKGTKSRDFVEHSGDVLCLSTFPQNILSANLFVSGSSDGSAKIWDLRSPTPTQSFGISNSDVNSVKVFPDGNAFATGSDDGSIRLFDLRSDCELGHYSLSSELRNKQNLLHLTIPSPADERYMKRFGNTTAQTYDEQSTSLLHSNGSSSGNIDQYSVNSLQSVIENQG
ncbi:guanine nucleotide-binding protein subunit beta, other, partial [Candida albicans P34048]